MPCSAAAAAAMRTRSGAPHRRRAPWTLAGGQLTAPRIRPDTVVSCPARAHGGTQSPEQRARGRRRGSTPHPAIGAIAAPGARAKQAYPGTSRAVPVLNLDGRGGFCAPVGRSRAAYTPERAGSSDPERPEPIQMGDTRSAQKRPPLGFGRAGKSP
jgi:hypothetical protein